LLRHEELANTQIAKIIFSRFNPHKPALLLVFSAVNKAVSSVV